MLNNRHKNNWPLHHAVSEGHLEIVNYLLSNKADVTVQTDNGPNVYHGAAYNGNLQILQALILHNNDHINDVNKNNWTPLHCAVSKGHLEIVNYLLSNKADVTVQTDEGWNIYRMAACDGYLQILQALIMHNNDYVNDVNKNNWTPLHCAVSKGHLQIVNYLLSNKADVTVQICEGRNVYHMAACDGYLQILQALILHNNDYINDGDKNNITPLNYAVHKGHLEIVIYLLSNKADVTVQTDDGWNVYHIAAYNGNVQIMQALILHNNDYINDVNKKNWTPLHHAVLKGHLEIVNYLLSNKADTTVQNGTGLNVYHVAAYHGNVQIFQALILHNNDYINDVNKKNWTPLHYAVSKGHLEIVKYLLSNKADVTVQTDDGRNVYDLAACYGYLQILKALIFA